MSNTRNTKTKKKPTEATPEATPSKELTDKFDMSHLTNEQRMLIADCLLSLIDFFKPQEGKTMDDVSVLWNVIVTRGKDTFLANVNGTSTFDGLLADNNLLNSTYTANMGLMDMVLIPTIGVIQNEVCRRALELADERDEEQLGL